MGHEISQFDIPGIQLPATNARSRAGMRKDIGVAKITHTIFGGVRVRIIREQDKKRRAWLLTALAVTALAVAAWQGWIAINRTSAPPLSAIRVSEPAYQPEYIPPTVTPQPVGSKPGTPPQNDINNPATSRKSAPQPPGLKASEPMAAQPVTAKPLQPPKLTATIRPAVPTVATPPAARPVANRPATVAQPVEPLIGEDASNPSPAGDNQPLSPVNAQP